jgi:GNAT superfamily N-acetyltransferase
VATDPDLVAKAMADTSQYLFEIAPLGWMRREAGLLAGATGLPLAMLNGIWAESRHPDAATVAAMLERLDAAALPYCMQLRPGTPGEIPELARARGMAQGESIPLMVLDVPSRLPAARDLEGFSVRILEPAEIGVHVRIATEAFGLPEDIFSQLMRKELLAAEGLRCYVGSAGGEDVATGMGITIGPGVGIVNIATTAAHRGHGYGAAITAQVALDGMAAGADWAWLQSSASGYNVYERLGFRPLEHWECFVSGA